MSDYKRLTKKEGIGRFVYHDCITCSQHKDDRTGCDFCGGSEYSNNWCCGVLYNRLAELENKIENGTLIELPCVRKINSALGKYEAVYFKEHFDTIQECVVDSIKQGWEIIAYYGNAHHKAIAEAELAKIRGQNDNND